MPGLETLVQLSLHVEFSKNSGWCCMHPRKAPTGNIPTVSKMNCRQLFGTQSDNLALLAGLAWLCAWGWSCTQNWQNQWQSLPFLLLNILDRLLGNLNWCFLSMFSVPKKFIRVKNYYQLSPSILWKSKNCIYKLPNNSQASIILLDIR